MVDAQALLDVLLAAGVVGVVANAVISHRRASAERRRELHGLLRILLVEIKANDRTTEALMSGDAGGRADKEGFEDEVWKEGRTRLAQLLPDEHDFHHLNIYYRNNANIGGLAFELARLDIDMDDPKNFPALAVREILEDQREMARVALDIVLKYVPEDPSNYRTREQLEEQIRRIDREVEDRRRGEEPLPTEQGEPD